MNSRSRDGLVAELVRLTAGDEFYLRLVLLRALAELDLVKLGELVDWAHEHEKHAQEIRRELEVERFGRPSRLS
jgi:hypothetical protein